MADPLKFRNCTTRPRVFITSDISNEPDDAQSLVRYLLYSNEFDTKGLVACTSTHMKRRVRPEDMIDIVNAYGEVQPKLNAHVHPSNPFPSKDSLLDLISAGPVAYGLEALVPGFPLSEGSKRLVTALLESEKPLWVLCWGGTNVLAQALQHIDKTYTEEQGSEIRARLRVYAISDQDDSGAWIRANYPDIFYICSIHGWSQYSMAAWLGISGTVDGQGPDQTQFTRPWIKEHIQIGPLGRVYPDHKFIVEGDTPTFLYLIQNGLGSPEHPEWGSWGGRYIPIDLNPSSRHYCDAVDTVVGKDGNNYSSNHATVWRWREAFQNDFAARMQWTLTENAQMANHAPVVIVNGSQGPEPLLLSVKPDQVIILDASATYDPDGDEMSLSWFQYREATTGAFGLLDQQVKQLPIIDLDQKKPGLHVEIQMPPADECAIDIISGKALERGQTFHLILSALDNGSPNLVTYKRVVIQIVNPNLEGGRETSVDTSAEWLELEGLI